MFYLNFQFHLIICRAEKKNIRLFSQLLKTHTLSGIDAVIVFACDCCVSSVLPIVILRIVIPGNIGIIANSLANSSHLELQTLLESSPSPRTSEGCTKSSMYNGEDETQFTTNLFISSSTPANNIGSLDEFCTIINCCFVFSNSFLR